LEIIEEENLVARADAIGRKTVEDLRRRLKSHSFVQDVRGLGLLIGVEIAGNKGDAIDRAERIMYASLRLGLNFKVSKGNILTFAPPLNVTEQELDQAWTIIEKAITEVEKRLA